MGFDISTLLQSFGYVFFLVFMLYGQKLMVMSMSAKVQTALRKFDKQRKSARSKILDSLAKDSPMDKTSIETVVDRMIKSFAINPVALDPQGIVPKMEHMFDTYDAYLKNTLQSIVPKVSIHDVESLENQLEVAIALDQIYRIVNHFFITGKKMGYIFMYQIAFMLPMIIEMANSMEAASEAFQRRDIIGDGFGPMVASRFVPHIQSREIEPETSLYETEFEGRRLLVVKARGPGGTVGRTGNAVQNLIEKNYTDIPNTKPVLLVTIDAALKLEGEDTGEIAEGVGVAMGGPGTDRSRIESACTNNKVPLFCLVCKMTEKEAITTMTEKIRSQVDEVTRRTQDLIRGNVRKDETVILVGVGNTMGVE